MIKPKTLLMVPLTSFMRNIPRFPDVGLGYLAAAIKRSGYEPFLRSWNMNPSLDDFKRYIKENSFDVIGMKVFTKDVAAANKTAKVIRSVSPETIIIVGGPHPSTSEPEDIKIDFPECDFAFRGEGEIGLPLLLKEIAKNGRHLPAEKLKGIHGLVWNSDGNIFANMPFLNPNLDSFGMPLWELMEPKDYKTPRAAGWGKEGYSAPIIVTRGCSSLCTYCAAYKINGKGARTRSTEAVMEEIEFLYNKYYVRHLSIMDTRFIQDTDVVTGICESIIRDKINITWDCVGYEKLASLTEDILRLMKKAGCTLMHIGIEGGSDRIRRCIKKIGTTKEIFQKVQMIKKSGIDVSAFFMIGFPEETKKDIEDTMNYAFSLPADNIQFEIPSPYPGTELFHLVKKRYGINRIDWESFDAYKSPYQLSEVSSSELYKILKKIRRRYFFLSLKRRVRSLFI